MSSQFALLKSRRFGPLFVTQFFGAFNDNMFKNALVVLLTFQASLWTSIKPELLSNLAAGIFILPFFLFSASAGQLADKFDKAKLARLVKVLEIGIMLIAGVGFWGHSLWVLMLSLFLFGLHSTLFGPIKYAILPQHLHENELVGGNALIEAGTFVSILIGTLAGGLLAGIPNGTHWITLGCIIVALLGYIASRSIPVAVPPEPELKINPNPFTETWRNIGYARGNRTVFLSILGISWFWLFGALFLAQFPAYAKNVLGGNETSVTLLLGVFTLGIGLGSLLCERLSSKQVEIGLVPFGSIGLTVFALDLAFASPGNSSHVAYSLLTLLHSLNVWHILFDLFAIGLFGGFFIVPLYALVQLRSSAAQRARIIATNNIMNALFMVCGVGAAAGLLAAGLSIPALFGVVALCNAAVAIYIYRLVPEFLIRFLIWLLIHSVYRLEKRQVERLPEEGAALLFCNHVSVVDALIIAAACHRPIRFVLNQRYFELPLLAFFLRESQAIALDSSLPSAEAFEKIRPAIDHTLAEGEMVAIFPEADITQDGELGTFQSGLETILVHATSPIIPLALNGLWGSIFSHHTSRSGRPFRHIRLSIGESLSGGVTLEALQQQIAALRASNA